MKIFVGKAEGRHFLSENKRFRDWFHVIFKEFWKIEWVGKLTANSDMKCINCLKRTSPENKPHLHGDKPLLTAPWSRAAAHLTQENQSFHAIKSLPVFLAQKIFFLFNTAFLGDKCWHHLGEATMFSWLHNFVIRNSHWIPPPQSQFWILSAMTINREWHVCRHNLLGFRDACRIQNSTICNKLYIRDTHRFREAWLIQNSTICKKL